MTTDVELNAENLVRWANGDLNDELGIDEDDDSWFEDGLGELSWGTSESPWGDITAVDGSEYSYGDGHPMGFVFTVAGRYFHASGTYSSWDGSDYDHVVEVVPVTVEVTRFKNKNSNKIFKDPVIEK